MRAWTALVLPVLMAGCGQQGFETWRQGMAEDSPTRHAWQYDNRADLYGALPASVRQLRDGDPRRVATAVCVAFGGTLNVVQSALPGRERLFFNCLFAEPDLTISMEMGELVRIRANLPDE